MSISKEKFEIVLKKVMEHNNFTPEMITVAECDKKDKWTPCDLVMREYYNNYGDSAKEFLGIEPATCVIMAEYIIRHQEELKEKDMYNKDGYNNFGCPLWHDYKLN